MANNGPDLEKIVHAVEDATTFPVLTESVSSWTGTSAGGPSPAATSSFGPLVRNALHEVLRWRPSVTDVKGLKEALLASFNAKEQQGRTVYTHVPRSYIMQVQSDGGAVTGAQASIHARTKAAVDQSLPLLEGLYPLDTDSDAEDLAAVRATIRLALTGLVDELARPGGPRVQRVDTIFELLLGEDIVKDPTLQFNSDDVGGQLGLLRDRLGLQIQRVNNSEEEKDLTNFLILADHVYTLFLSWSSLRGFFDRQGTDVFLGPQLVLLSRALRVISESVQETYTALNSVFVGPAEREVILLSFSGNQPPMTLADLLEWVDSASSEGQQLIQEAGKDGVIAFRSTLNQLSALLHEAVALLRQSPSNPTRAVHTRRVGVAVEALSIHVDAAIQLASPLSRLPQPEIETIDPDSAPATSGFRLQIEGDNFDPDAEALLLPPSELEDADEILAIVHFVSPTTLIGTFDLTEAEPGIWTVVVRNPDGVESELEGALTIEGSLLEPPEISRLDPDTVTVGDEDVEMVLLGSGFQEGATVSVSGEGVSIDSESVTLEGDSRLTFTIDVDDDAPPGTRTLTLTNPPFGLATGLTAETDFEVEDEEVEAPFSAKSATPNHRPRGVRKGKK